MARPTDTADVRRHNTSLVMRHVVDDGPTSRANIRRATGLVSGSVTSIVADLMLRGLVVESGEHVVTGGRPQRVIEVNAARVLGLVASISREWAIVDVVDLEGSTLETVVRSRPEDVGRSAALSALAEALDAAWVVAHQVPDGCLVGSVIIAPGPVADDSVMTDSIELGLRDLDFHRELSALLSHPHQLRVLNVGRLGAIAEFEALAPTDRPRAMAYIASGAGGVGGGIVVDRHVFGGEHGLAGEVGHIVTDMSGPLCGCGARGCLSLYVGTAAMLSRSTGGTPSTPGLSHPAESLRALAASGDLTTLAVLAEAGTALAAAVATMSNYTDVGTVVLGGELPQFQAWFAGPLDTMLASRRAVSPRFNPTVRLAQHGTLAPRIGAWLTLRNMVLSNPGIVPVISATQQLTA